MDAELNELLQRGVLALERLSEDPKIEIPALPAVCPHCDTMNPIIRTEESQATGKLAEFVIQAHCLQCNEVFFALPLQWVCVKTASEAREADQERQELGGYSN